MIQTHQVYSDTNEMEIFSNHYKSNTIMTLVQRPGSTLVDVPRILSDDSFRQKVVKKYCDQVLKNFLRISQSV